jgi:hypothetical protein
MELLHSDGWTVYRMGFRKSDHEADALPTGKTPSLCHIGHLRSAAGEHFMLLQCVRTGKQFALSLRDDRMHAVFAVKQSAATMRAKTNLATASA